jgi:membrane fusion protein, multidrug efflux system
MKRRSGPLVAIWAAAAAILVSANLNACRSSGTDENSDEASAPPPVMAVTGAIAQIGPIASEERLLGQTVAVDQLPVRAPAAGRVIGLNLQTGDSVKRGQIIAHILSREVEAAENGLAIATKLDAQDAEELTAAVKRYSHGSGIALVAPEDGEVAQRMVSSGQMVADLDPIVILIDPRSIYVSAAVPSGELASIHPGMMASVTSPIRPGEIYAARVAAISPSFEQNAESLAARVEFVGVRRIEEAGAPVEIIVTTAHIPAATLIPIGALFQSATNDQYYVFTLASGRAHRVPVTVGLRENGMVQITSGIKPGQVVITSGGYALSDGLRVEVAITGR